MMRSIRCLIVCFLALCAAQAQDDFYHPELEWRTIETEHFFVHYHEGTERTARVAAKVAEEIYGPVTSLYHHVPDSKVSFIIKDYDDYSNGAAYFYDNKIEIWAPSLDTDLRGTHTWLRNVITHEFTHIVQIQTTIKFGRKVPGIYLQWLGYENERRTDVLYGYPNTIVSYPISGFVVPSWFAEGVAQFNRKELQYDTWDSHRDMILRMYALDGNMLSWNEMAVFGKTSLGNESSYNAGFAFVRYLNDRYGDQVLPAISRHLSSFTALTIDDAIERTVGKSGKDLYGEWKEYLKTDYRRRTAAVEGGQVAGEQIGAVGFANFTPAFSPDGKKIAYTSNKEGDYFFQSSLYVYDVASKTEELIQAGVRSSISWSPDGKKLYYAKHSRDNEHWSNYLDLYVYDLETKDETRLTYGRRAGSPALSPDGKRLAYVAGADGTLNLYVMDVDGRNMARRTNYANGEQVYSPSWSPDSKTLLFDYSIADGRDLATVPADGGDVTFLLQTPDDERNAVFTADGASVVYASDKSGIFNLYRRSLETKETVQLTNVLGGAFMPSVAPDGKIAFSAYTSTGYKLALLAEPRPIAAAPAYDRSAQPVAREAFAADPADSAAAQFDWQALHKYDDTSTPAYTDTKYKNITTSLSIVPFLRVDNYNPKNKGIDVIKPGFYAFSYDVLEHYGFFASGAMNRKGERDLFFTVDYRGKIPGLFDLGLEPAMSLEAYNITRKTDTHIQLPLENIPVDITYNLLEFDVAFKQKVFTEALEMELRYAHSRYTASLSSFFLPEANVLVQATDVLYLVGNDLSVSFTLNGILPSRTMEINPVGRKLKLRYDREFNKFNPKDTLNARGELVHLYERPSFHKLEASWKESRRLPWGKHTLSALVRGGTIFGPAVDDFFDFYIGGLAGMKGYPFYSMGGNEFASANLTYRFPVAENIDLRLAQLYFDKLYAAVYGDVGSAWTEGGLSGRRFRRDVGMELRLEAFSYYSYPTRIFFNATYGLDRFDRYIESRNETVTYGKEWNFHVGVLFGFDFD
jgi:Tol biopolymer transport system component